MSIDANSITPKPPRSPLLWSSATVAILLVALVLAVSAGRVFDSAVIVVLIIGSIFALVARLIVYRKVSGRRPDA